jgi:hypothetical protein
MMVPMLYFAWRYPLLGNTRQLVDIGKMAQYEWDEFAGYVGGMVVLYALYLLALWESRRVAARRAMPAVVGCGTAMALAMAWMYPVNAIDIFIYAVRSRLFTEYGVNPIAAYPADYWSDPFMRFASQEWADNVSPYGPLWNLIAAPVTYASGDRIGVALVGFKVLAVIAALVGTWIVVRTVAVERPNDVATAAILFLWNPLVLWEGVGNGHNDLVLAVPLLLAMLAWAKRRDRFVIPLLVVGVLIKYVTVVVIPIAVVALWRRAGSWEERWRLVVWSGGLSLVAVAIGFAPFFDVGAVRESIASQGNIYLTSPAAMAIGLLRDRYDVVEIRRWGRMIGEGVLIATMAWQATGLWARPRRLPRATFEVLFVFLLVATWNFRGWYLIWPVALAAVLPWGWPAWRMIAWTAGAMSVYALFIWGWEWWGTDFYTLQNVGVPMIFGAAVLLTVVELLGRARGRKREPAVEIGYDSLGVGNG